MTERRLQAHARVRHEPDRSYTVLVQGPDGEREVGTTAETGRLGPLARSGAARLHGVDEAEVELVSLDVPRPPYGRDGQWVRVVQVENLLDPSEAELLGRPGRASWLGGEGAWLVLLSGGAGVFPGEHLDFDPDVTPAEAAEMEAYVDGDRSWDQQR
ncbi:hypothetical protein [Motilibacter aurantiacus]|uniref:hypothetical protein n=1 Tax=Motilibacter aurantiacus TaxID=2714955 RepID=UPI00140CB044|nr:hypothetical protein [Motilibacter aurantiacus]NHC45424.1 hypothetical protein [Motilibacter aurantiacus]